MRSTVLFASAMAIGAIAGPLHKHKRYIVTAYNVKVVTETVYVTAVVPAPVPTVIADPKGDDQHDSTSAPAPTIIADPKGDDQHDHTSAPAPTVKPEPVPTSVYTSPPPPPPPATPKPEPQPAPTSVNAPEPEPTGVTPNRQHISGTAQDELHEGPEYEAAMLYHHNAARANHGAAPMVWDEECKKHAEQNARKCDFKHKFYAEFDEGQNLFTVSGDAFNATAGVNGNWYRGEFKKMTDNKLWGVKDIVMPLYHEVGHLTQMLWDDTTKVGCYTMACDNMKVGGKTSAMNKYTVCNYSPRGNGGDFDKHVGMPISYTNLGNWSD